MNIFDNVPLIASFPDEPEYDCGNGARLRLYRNKDIGAYADYCSLLENSGFSLYDRTQCENNEFRVYTRGELKLFVYFTPCDGTVRVVADGYTLLPAKEPLPTAEKYQTVLYQFETDHSLIDCGMCYIVRCSDGSFFIVDSAHMYSVNDNDRIHDFLRSLTPDGEKIHIAGWFFSHGHTDHICKFLDFLRYNMSDCVLDGVYYNFVAPGHRDENCWEESERQVRLNFAADLAAHPEIKKYKLHSGQRFFINDLEFFVMASHEDVYPASMSDFNDTSTALMMTYKGYKVCLPGDASRMSSDVITSRYSDFLACDIMQVSHHGHTGCRTPFYERAHAPVALFPNTRIKLDEENARLEENRRIIEIADRYFVSSEGTVGFPLPYTPGSEIVYPDETTENFDGIYALWGYTYSDEFKAKVKSDFESRKRI